MPKGIRVKTVNRDKLGAKELGQYGDLAPKRSKMVSYVGKGPTKKGREALGPVVTNFVEVMRRPNQTEVGADLKKALGKDLAKQLEAHRQATQGSSNK